MWRSIRPALLFVLLIGVMSSGCGLFNPDEDPGPPPPPEQIPPPSSPENIIKALEIIYDDTIRSAAERRDAYTELFPPDDRETVPPIPGFIFRLQPEDAIEIGQETWGLDQEIRVHEGMFGAQDSREIFSLTLDVTHGPATPIEFPGPGQDDWMEIFASNVNLRLLFAPDDGLAVNGGQGRYLFPADDRWYLAEWIDLPSPTGP